MIYIGGDFVRKGGTEIVQAFDKVSKSIDNLELILIGNLESNYNYAFKNFQDDSVYIEKIKKIIKENHKIIHYDKLPNSEVIELIEKSNVGLLPTWGDTYGYSVLEFQAAGCPVITTNVRALTEINSNDCGWIIELPLNKFKEVGITNQNQKETLRKKIINDLENIFIEISKDNSNLLEKSQKSLDRIKKYHNPIDYERKLKTIYKECFK